MNKHMNRIHVVLLIFLLFSIMLLGTACAVTKQSETALVAEATTEPTTESTTEAPTEVPTEVPTVPPTGTETIPQLSELEISEIETEIDILIESIQSQIDDLQIQNILDQFVAASPRELYYLYYGKADNAFWISPKTELPPDYEFTQRPVYLNAMEQGLYVQVPYSDWQTERIIYTIAKAIRVDDEIVGVIGIDVLGDH